VKLPPALRGMRSIGARRERAARSGREVHRGEAEGIFGRWNGSRESRPRAVAAEDSARDARPRAR
jgi:hypothetical protein